MVKKIKDLRNTFGKNLSNKDFYGGCGSMVSFGAPGGTYLGVKTIGNVVRGSAELSPLIAYGSLCSFPCSFLASSIADAFRFNSALDEKNLKKIAIKNSVAHGLAMVMGASNLDYMMIIPSVLNLLGSEYLVGKNNSDDALSKSFVFQYLLDNGNVEDSKLGNSFLNDKKLKKEVQEYKNDFSNCGEKNVIGFDKGVGAFLTNVCARGLNPYSQDKLEKRIVELAKQ